MIELVSMLCVASFALGFFACLGLWHRAMRRDLERVENLSEAFEDYIAISNKPTLRRVEARGDWR